MDKVNDGESKFNIWDNHFVEHEYTVNLMFNMSSLYKGGLGEKNHKKLVLKNLKYPIFGINMCSCHMI